ncbi:MAG: hypothetical protein AAGA48_17935 [Myxococcota bacterium]
MSTEPPSAARWPAWIEEWVLPYLNNASLWPVWIALIGHVVVGIAGLMLLGVRQSLPEAWFVLVLLGLGSGWLVAKEWQVSAKLGGVALTVVLGWAASAGLAWLAEAIDLF